MVRVLYDHEISCLQPYGGISRYFTELAPRIAAAGIPVTAFRGLHLSHGILAPHPLLTDYGMRLPNPAHTFRLRMLANRALFAGCAAAFAQRRRGLLHLTYYSAPPLGWKGPVVTTFFDAIHLRLPQYFPTTDPTVGRIRTALARATAVIAISASAADDASELYGIPRERIRVIHLGTTSLPAPKADRPLAAPYLLHVGNRRGYKNYAALRTAYETTPALFQHYELVCCGGGPPSADECPALGRAHFLSGGDDLLSTLYYHAALFVLPSLYEGFGLPVVEAMATNTPLVALRVGSIPEVAGDAALLVPAGDPAALAAGLLAVLNDPLLRQTLIANGQRQAQRFTWERCAAEHVALYRSVGDG